MARFAAIACVLAAGLAALAPSAFAAGANIGTVGQVPVLNRSIGTRSSVFAEYAGFYTHHLAPLNIAHFGAVRKLNKNNQIDIQFGFGMNKAAPAAFVGAGYSFRFDRLPGISQL